MSETLHFLDVNPLTGLTVPKEKNPHRPVLSDEAYTTLVEVADEVDPRFKVALVLAHETGHRQQAICHLRWSDVDLDGGWVTWRAEHDKAGRMHRTPLTDVAIAALRAARQHLPQVGDAWLFPAPRRPARPCGRSIMSRWFRRAAERATLALPAKVGFHSLRRKFATELKHVPLPDLCALGGWKDAKTILTCYQAPDEQTMRAALTARRRLPNGQSRDSTAVRVRASLLGPGS